MDQSQLRNTMRQWVRAQVATLPALSGLPLVVTNEESGHGVDVVWMRQTIQTTDGRLVGVGTDRRRHRRIARLFLEVFGPVGTGEARVSSIATAAEGFFRNAMPLAQSPDPLITLGEPSTFERKEPNRYCQVVSVPMEVDHFT